MCLTLVFSELRVLLSHLWEKEEKKSKREGSKKELKKKGRKEEARKNRKREKKKEF